MNSDIFETKKDPTMHMMHDASTQGQFPLRPCSHCWSYGLAFLCGALGVGEVKVEPWQNLKVQEGEAKDKKIFKVEKRSTLVLNSW